MGWDTLQAGVLWRYNSDDQLMKELDSLRAATWITDLGATSGDDIGWGYVQAIERCLLTDAAVDRVKELSQQRPLLFFLTTDEFYCETEAGISDFSGWCFRIYHRGEEKARVEFSYHWPSYGDTLKSLLVTALADFDNTLFSLFELSQDRQLQLQQLLTPSQLFNLLEDTETLEDIERMFTRLLDIEIDFLGNE